MDVLACRFDKIELDQVRLFQVWPGKANVDSCIIFKPNLTQSMFKHIQIITCQLCVKMLLVFAGMYILARKGFIRLTRLGKPMKRHDLDRVCQARPAQAGQGQPRPSQFMSVQSRVLQAMPEEASPYHLVQGSPDQFSSGQSRLGQKRLCQFSQGQSRLCQNWLVQSSLVQGSPGQARRGQSQATPGQFRLVQGIPGQVRLGQNRLVQASLYQGIPGKVRTGQSRTVSPGYSRLGQKRLGQASSIGKRGKSSYRRNIQNKGVLVLVRVDAVDSTSKVSVAVQKMRPRHEDRREPLATADVQKTGRDAGLLEAVALVVRVVLGRVEGVLDRREPEGQELVADDLLTDVLEGQGPASRLSELLWVYQYFFSIYLLTALSFCLCLFLLFFLSIYIYIYI